MFCVAVIICHINVYANTVFFLGGPKVYDVSKYLNDHPGGPEIIMDFAGEFKSCSSSQKDSLVYVSLLMFRQGC